MKVKVNFHSGVKKFAAKEKLKIADIKNKILDVMDELLSGRSKQIKCNSVLVVVNGIQNMKNKKAFVNPHEPSKKALRTVIYNKLLPNYSLYFSVFKEK